MHPDHHKVGCFYYGEVGLSIDLDEGLLSRLFLVSHQVGFEASAESFPFWITTRSFL